MCGSNYNFKHPPPPPPPFFSQKKCIEQNLAKEFPGTHVPRLNTTYVNFQQTPSGLELVLFECCLNSKCVGTPHSKISLVTFLNFSGHKATYLPSSGHILFFVHAKICSYLQNGTSLEHSICIAVVAYGLASVADSLVESG